VSTFAIPFTFAFCVTVAVFAYYNSSPSPLSTGSTLVVFGFALLVSWILLLIFRKTTRKKKREKTN